MQTASPNFAPDALEVFAQSLFEAAGMDAAKAGRVAELLVLTDEMGRRTHGLAMVPLYLADIAKGGMTLTGSPQVIADRGPTLVWDANYLPGLWVMSEAIATAIARIPAHGVVSIAIRKCHHIGCLAAHVKH